MRRFRRFRLAGGRFIRWVVLLGVASYLVLRLVEATVIGPLVAVAETEARLRGIDAVNRVVLEAVSKSAHHGEMVTYVKDTQGRIAAYQINTRAVNAIASEAATQVHQAFQLMAERDFKVPAGALSGSKLLAAQGPGVPVRLLPVGSVSIDVRHEFKGEGINQTRHRIWLHASATVRVILPVVTREVVVTSDMPITETVIVGPVPNSFYGGKIDGVTVPATGR
ncbi:MAG TPA: sporulation protein YunB [Symbiobacteriaceae bacterium]|nr:sporulation protein YunB [Symbiobacteriaceae bacterium]